MPNKRQLMLVIGALAASAVAAGCGNDDESSNGSASQNQTTQQQSTEMSKKAADNGSADLRAGLTYLLEEHVYLAGVAISKGVSEGLDSKDFEASAATLDENTKALGKAIGSVYGDEAEKGFLETWRAHIGFFVDYTKGKATNNEKAMTKAKKDLDGYRQGFGQFLASANPNLTAEAVADELEPHVESVLAVIDSVVEKDGETYAKLREAADHMPGTANVLAGAIAEQKDLGNPEAGASELRSTLTAALTEHVYLASLTVDAGVGAGLDSKAFKAAAGELDENTKALGSAIGSVYGDEAEKGFLETWRAHIGFFVDYTAGKATKDKAMVRKAEKDLDGYRQGFGQFLAGANPNLTAEAVADELKPHVESLFDTIDARVAGKPATYERMRAAAGHMPGTAKVLADAIAAQFPDKFPAS